jgi:hypothetical protein
MARLPVSKETLRNLSIASKNKCAMPGCDHPLLSEKGEYIAELCHIEAAEPGGPRYNPSQSDEERRSASNLVFLCHRHHRESDDVKVYTVAKLREIKVTHERLPEVEFNSEKLVAQVESIAQSQAKILAMLEKGAQSQVGKPQNFPIIVSGIRDAWTPESGRFFESNFADQSGFKYMMKDGWLHIEHRLSDGGVAYYEANEHGSCRHASLPYPIDEYRVEIPSSLVLDVQHGRGPGGLITKRTNLKWSRGYVVERYLNGRLCEVDMQTRTIIENSKRLIRVCEPPSIPQQGPS